MSAVLLRKYVDALIAPITTAFSNAQARLQSEIEAISSSGGGPTGGTEGQVLVSGGTSAPDWSPLLVIEQPTSFTGNLELSSSDNVSVSSIANISFVAVDIDGTYPDINIILEPLGNGGFIIGPTPDGTTTGGASRGKNSIDLQVNRLDQSQVTAGDFSVITGGAGNFNGGTLSVIGGGLTNQITPDVSASFIGGGENNSIGTIGSTFDHTAIGGGFGNAAGCNSGAIFAGSSNQVYADYSGVFCGLGNYVGGGTYSLITGGQYNEADGSWAVIVGGQDNFSNSNFSFIGSGLACEVTGDYSSVVGGEDNNVISSQFAFIGGGYQSAVINSDYSLVGGGNSNQITGSPYSGIYGGSDNQINSANYSFIAAGSTNNLSGNYYSTILNGTSCSISGNYSTVINGVNVSDKGRTGWTGYSTGTFGQSGDQQAGMTVLSGFTTVGATFPFVLTSGNSAGTYNSPAANNINNLVPFSAMAVKGMLIGTDSITLDSAAWHISFLIKQGGGGASETAIVGSPTIELIAADSAFSSIVVAITADTTNGGLSISVSNPAGWTNVAYWEASLFTAELVIPAN